MLIHLSFVLAWQRDAIPSTFPAHGYSRIAAFLEQQVLMHNFEFGSCADFRMAYIPAYSDGYCSLSVLDVEALKDSEAQRRYEQLWEEALEVALTMQKHLSRSPWMSKVSSCECRKSLDSVTIAA